MFKEEIIKLLKPHVKGMLNLEIPPDSKMGDYAFTCFTLAKELKKNPNEIAKEIAEKIQPNEFVKEITSLGPYVNFFINKQKLAEFVITEIISQKNNYGNSDLGKEQTVLVEFPGPNTNKPLHLGHMRNMALGASISNIMETQSYNVKRVNIINDRGIHICKSMLAYQKYGENKTPEETNMKSDHFVGKYYVLFNEKSKQDPELEKQVQVMLQKWEAEDPEIREIWEKMNHWAFQGFNQTYKNFGLKPFDKEYLESNTYKKGKEIVMKGMQKGLFFQRDDNAIVIDLSNEGLGEKVLIRPNGTSVYVTQDLYVAEQRYEDFKFNKSIYVVASEQNYHFKVLFTLLKKLGYPWADGCYHFSYGMVNLPEGKMKSREGTVVDADDLMLEMEDLAKEQIQKRHENLDEKELKNRSKIVGLGAIKFYLLKNDAIKDMTFYPEESLSFEGDTGPYLQYTHARANSIIKKVEKEKSITPNSKIDFNLLTHPLELQLITLLSLFTKKTGEAAMNYRPHIIAQYLLELGRAFNEFYHSCHCLKEKNIELAKARLTLIDCSKQVIKNGLNMLGIQAPEEM